MGIFNRIFGSFGGGPRIARRLTINDLSSELDKLKSGYTEFDFLGITSNGTDCIYFVQAGEKFHIEYEAMTTEQLPYIEKLKTFGEANGFETSMSSYGNKPHFASVEDAPVISIKTDSDITMTVEIARSIQNTVFCNDDTTEYDVVP
ncbi:MAG TPA: hypothetical protein PKD24_00960 [Pyrinomonadaceae bacterium]|nr:hypothetical protein [Pyrinomonadaceae bacterium]HMP64274.1 hypothetical protein [Pyrinomonadaceae bacterium]